MGNATISEIIKEFIYQKLIFFNIIFRAYENFREKRKLAKLRKIVIEKKEKERKRNSRILK